MSYKTIANNID